jgi:hypothetical protein
MCVPTCGVHFVVDLDPQDPLFRVATILLVVAYIDGARHLLEVWPRSGCEACRQRIFGKERPTHCCETGSRRCLVLGVGVGFGRNMDTKVCDDLVGCAAAVAGLEWRKRLDLEVVNASECS